MRDRGKHASPNAGQSEAAFAGALGLRLGGKNSYDGIIERIPYIGDEIEFFTIEHIDRANAIMLIASGCFIVTASLGVHLFYYFTEGAVK
jgi:adenosylcobinamide-phosphate synthase